jgi:NAD(P)-dependent dehydrogenase (short-subunit alcohol dehydrogenase family)
VTRVLVIGAGGVFGSRLAKGLVRDGFEVVVAGRSLQRAEVTRAEVGAASAAALDTRNLTAADLTATGAGIVVDAAGPFQGAEPRVARAAIEAGLSYVDLADARDFVAGFGALDADAKAGGVTALTGASSTPALSNAVLDALTEGWMRIDAVEAAISPGARAPRGRSVTEAILSWLGRPVRVFENGRWGHRTGWGEVWTRDFGPAGRRRLSLCETPDLDVLAERFRPTDRALFMAGLVPGLAHWGAWGLARLVKATGADPRPLAGVVMKLSERTSAFGDDRGAMRVEATGRDAQGRAVRAVWLLVAPPGVGPVTPGIPALAAVKAMAAGRLKPGARACVGELALAELEAELAVHGIAVSRLVEPSSLFARAIGPAFDRLPAPIRALHETTGQSVWRGTATVDGAANPPAGLVARVFGFPRAGQGVPVEVTVDADRDRSVWRREIGGGRFLSVLSSPREGGRVVESFGPCAFDLTLTPEDDRLVYRVQDWRLLGVPMPRAWAPTTATHEKIDAEGRFAFDVEIGLPIVGRMVRYRGWLEAV